MAKEGKKFFKEIVKRNKDLLNWHDNLWNLFECMFDDLCDEDIMSTKEELIKFNNFSFRFKRDFENIEYKPFTFEEMQYMFEHKWNFKFYLMLIFFIPVNVPIYIKKLYLLIIFNECFDFKNVINLKRKKNNELSDIWNDYYDIFYINLNKITEEKVNEIFNSMVENYKPYYILPVHDHNKMREVINFLANMNLSNNFFDNLGNLLLKYKDEYNIIKFLSKVGQFAINSIVYLKFSIYDYHMYDLLDMLRDESEYVKTNIIYDAFCDAWHDK